MAGGGGSSGGFESYLPIAAALAATVMTDGAAAPLLEESLGTAGAAAFTGAGIGAVTGGGVAALTGQNVAQNALMGGIGGATLGYGGLYSGAPEAGMTFAGTPITGSIASPAATTALGELSTAPTAAGGLSPYSEALGSSLSTTPESGAAYFNAIAQPGAAPVLSASSDAALASATGASAAGGAGAAGAGAGAGLFGTGITGTQAAMGLGGIGLLGAMAQDNKRYGGTAAAATPYTGGNLSKFHYDPANYHPDVVQPPNPLYQANYSGYARPPGYAGGGLLDPNSEPVDFMGGGMYPQSQQVSPAYATPTQMPTSAQQTAALYEPKTNPLTGEMTANMAAGGTGKDALADLMGSRDAVDQYVSQYQTDPATVAAKAKSGDYNAMLAMNKINNTPNANYAQGGIANLGGYSDGGRMLKGPGDGMSDSIPASIQGKQPARLADNEFVVPADVVSHLGNGSSDAGAKKLYAMMSKVRKARTGKAKQAPAIKADKYMPA